jgi:hypothetical protein
MNEDIKWQALLAQSAPTFAGEATPPYGFMTSTLAGLTAEKREQTLLEKISFRALFASLAILAVTVAITIGFEVTDHSDLDPGVRSLLQIENISVS